MLWPSKLGQSLLLLLLGLLSLHLQPLFQVSDLLVLPGSKDGDEVVNDGIFRAGRLQLEQDPLLLLAGIVCFVNIVPTVRSEND